MRVYVVSGVMRFSLIALLLLTVPVLAVHTSDVGVSPGFIGATKETAFALNVTNDGKDNISEVRTRIPIEFSALKCGTAPQGWTLAYSDAVECNYKTVSAYLAAGNSVTFMVNATTAASTGNYTWEVRSRDVFDGFSLHNPVVVIDATAPTMKTSTLKSPNGGEKWEAATQHDIVWEPGDITDTNIEDTPIMLEYTADGKTWNKITENQANDGVYAWMVPGDRLGNAKVRLTATDKTGNKATDVSDANFTIAAAAPTVTIKEGESRTLDVNKDGRNDTIITARDVTSDSAVLLVESIAVPTPTPVPATPSNVTTPKPTEREALANPTVAAIVIILVLIILYLIWRLQQIEKRKK